MDSHDGLSKIPDEIHCSSSDLVHSLVSTRSISLQSLLMAQDWEAALCLAEDDPQQAQEWIYGAENGLVRNTSKADQVVWKRLALHLACVHRAPVGLVEVLIEAYPDAASMPEPHSGCLPLHYACQYRASFRVIKALLVHCSAATKAVDHHGRLPLHYAILSSCHYAIIELLVTIDPESSLVMEPSHKLSLPALAKNMYGPRSPVVRLLEMVSSVFQKNDTSLLEPTPLIDSTTNGLTSWESI